MVATFPGDETYRPAQASYTINVIAADANDGSLEKPYTASEAKALALAGNTNSYYIIGYVTSIPYEFDQAHGYGSFWIHDSADGSSQTFEGYKVKYFNNEAWLDGNATLSVDDKVLLYGKLTKYNSIAETAEGTAYLVKVNDKAGLTVPSLSAEPDDSNKQIAVTWGAATGSAGTITYTVTCGDQQHVATAAGSHTFTMANYGTYDVKVVATASDAWNSMAATSATLTDSSPTALAGLSASWSLTSGESTSLSAGSGNTDATITVTNSNSNKINGYSAGIASQKMAADNYWLFTIPNVANVLSTTEVTIAFSGVKVNKTGTGNVNIITYQLAYSWDNSTWTDVGDTYTETTTATNKSYTFKPGAKDSGTLYIRYLATSGGVTTAGSHYLGGVTLSAE